MSYKIEKPVVIWVEWTSPEGDNDCGYINNFDGLHYLVTPQSAEVFELVKAQTIINILSGQDPKQTFTLKYIK